MLRMTREIEGVIKLTDRNEDEDEVSERRRRAQGTGWSGGAQGGVVE
jgi:hypothetical protein